MIVIWVTLYVPGAVLALMSPVMRNLRRSVLPGCGLLPPLIEIPD